MHSFELTCTRSNSTRVRFLQTVLHGIRGQYTTIPSLPIACLSVTTALLGVLGLVQLSLMFIWLDKQKISSANPFQAGLIGYGYIVIAPLCILTAAVGGYGAHRIKQDLQKHVHGDGTGSMHNVLELKEDKGQEEWLSHRLLLVSVG